LRVIASTAPAQTSAQTTDAWPPKRPVALLSFDFAFVRPELIDDPRYYTAEARSRISEEVVALLDEATGGRDIAE
jgi:crotonobetainyl-CoA:carnitine CoA-transferase CaiB-like acyl-CoA transferase